MFVSDPSHNQLLTLQALTNLKRNALDDGSVVNHHNLDKTESPNGGNPLIVDSDFHLEVFEIMKT